MVAKPGLQADQAGKHNVTFLSYFLLGDLERCLEILLTSNKDWNEIMVGRNVEVELFLINIS